MTARKVSAVPLEPITRAQAEEIVTQRRAYGAAAALVLHPLTQARYRYVPGQALGLDRIWACSCATTWSARFSAGVPPPADASARRRRDQDLVDAPPVHVDDLEVQPFHVSLSPSRGTRPSSAMMKPASV